MHGEERGTGNYYELMLSVEELGALRAADLRRAMVASSVATGSSAHAAVLPVPVSELDEDLLSEPVSFETRDEALDVRVTCWSEWPESGQESDAVARLEKLVLPFLHRMGAEVGHIECNLDNSNQWGLSVEIILALPWRGKTVAELYAVGNDVHRLSEAFTNQDITRETVADLVRGGSGHLLIDQPESNWLDAKSQEYDLTGLHGKISLAQAVARFANGEDGGLVVIGAHTKAVPGGEVISRVRGLVPRHMDSRSRYQRVLDERLYPPVLGLLIDVVPVEAERVLILIDVPPQPEESKPFLVHGAITADGKTEGAFISIVQRRGEGSIPISAPMIHATLAAGRALLRGRVSGLSDKLDGSLEEGPSAQPLDPAGAVVELGNLVQELRTIAVGLKQRS